MKCYSADLHIHSCLSPCADILMLPNLIAEKLKYAGIEIASITDHNSLLNIKAFSKVFKKYQIFLIPGIEVQTTEEVHVLGYFENIEIAMKFQKEFEKYLPKIKNKEELLGYQLLTNEKDEYIEKYETALSFSSSINLENLSKLIKKFNGICVAAHIDKTFGVINQLGMIPKNIFDAVEVFKSKNKISNYTNISSSDAHYLNDIKTAKMKICIERKNFEEFKKAILSTGGRSIKLQK